MAQTGKVFDNLSLKSKILNMDRKYSVYLPPDYETSNRSYPVLYLLHDAGDDQTGLVQFGEVSHITDKAIKEGKSTPVTIVMPDAQTGRRGYFNTIRGDFQYEDFFSRNLYHSLKRATGSGPKNSLGLFQDYQWVVAGRSSTLCTIRKCFQLPAL
jgi:enterochelin esterase-like enzyme